MAERGRRDRVQLVMPSCDVREAKWCDIIIMRVPPRSLPRNIYAAVAYGQRKSDDSKNGDKEMTAA